MDTESYSKEKLSELKKYRELLKNSGGAGNEFEEHVFWLCEVAEGSYCISPHLENKFWQIVDEMLTDTLTELFENYEIVTKESKVLIQR